MLLTGGPGEAPRDDEGRFDIDDVAEKITAKIRHRHPHIFAEAENSGYSSTFFCI